MDSPQRRIQQLIRERLFQQKLPQTPDNLSERAAAFEDRANGQLSVDIWISLTRERTLEAVGLGEILE